MRFVTQRLTPLEGTVFIPKREPGRAIRAEVVSKGALAVSNQRRALRAPRCGNRFSRIGQGRCYRRVL